MSSNSKRNIMLIKELIKGDSYSNNETFTKKKNNQPFKKENSKKSLIKRELKLDMQNAKEFVPKIPTFANIPKITIKKEDNRAVNNKEIKIEELSKCSFVKALDKKCKEKAIKALNKLSPGKKALLQNIFMSKKETTIKDVAEELKESEEKIEELKANALRNLIYGKS